MARITNKQIKTFWLQSTLVARICLITIAAFVVIGLVDFLFAMFSSWPLNIKAYMAFYPRFGDFVEQPWGVLTYLFAHANIFHLLFNMLWLYWFGQLFLRYFTPRRMLALYLVGGIGAALFYMLIYHLLHMLGVLIISAPLVGASGAVMAVVFAVACYARWEYVDLMFVGRVKIVYVALFLFLLDLLMLGRDNNFGGHLAHLGGASIGYLFAYMQTHRHKDITLPMQRLIERIDSMWLRMRDAVVRKHKRDQRQWQRTHSPKTDNREFINHVGNETESSANTSQARIDEILDKIKASGYSSLTDEEKKELFRHSKNV